MSTLKVYDRDCLYKRQVVGWMHLRVSVVVAGGGVSEGQTDGAQGGGGRVEPSPGRHLTGRRTRCESLLNTEHTVPSAVHETQ